MQKHAGYLRKQLLGFSYMLSLSISLPLHKYLHENRSYRDNNSVFYKFQGRRLSVHPLFPPFLLLLLCFLFFDSDRDEDAGVAVVRQQGVLPAARLRVLDVGPALHEVAVGHDARQLARHGAVEGLGDAKVRGEEDVEVALVNLEGKKGVEIPAAVSTEMCRRRFFFF